MPIHALLEQEQAQEEAVFSPEDLTAIIAAYELALTRLKVDDRKAPMATLIAKTVIQILIRDRPLRGGLICYSAWA
jgi:hypothetical protein